MEGIEYFYFNAFDKGKSPSKIVDDILREFDAQKVSSSPFNFELTVFWHGKVVAYYTAEDMISLGKCK